MIPSQACMKPLTEADVTIMKMMLEGIAILEFMRASGIDRSSVIAALEKELALLRSNPNYNPTVDSYNPETDKESAIRLVIRDALGSSFTNAEAFVNWIEFVTAGGSDKGIPGFDNATCSMNWQTFACFCNAAAKAFVTSGPAATEAFLSSYDEAVGMQGCDPAVLAEPDKVEEKASILPWVGAALVATLGLGWVVFGKKGR